MLIRFKVSNFLSFKEETEFSMVAGRERLHPNHIIKGAKNQPNLLRAALLYGANAAGKSNFVKAIDYAKSLIINKTLIFDNSHRGWYRDYLHADDIFNKKFKLDKKYLNKSTDFVFEFISDGIIYEYGFKLSELVVSEEWLFDFSQETKKVLFKRQTTEDGITTFDKENFLSKKSDKEFLGFVQRSTVPNKLFLSHSIENNVEWFCPAFLWFQDSLNTAFPHTEFGGIEEKLRNDENFHYYFTEVLKKAQTDISSVEVKEFERETNSLNSVIRLAKTLKGYWGPAPPVKEKEFEKVLKLILLHRNTEFERSEESDGTNRLFEIICLLYDLIFSKGYRIYIVDELERRLHTNLSYMLLKSYLEQEGKGQLIATTHDTHLLDLELLRKDEIWFAEKDEHGATQLYSLYEFNPRYDKKIEKEYLTGRFGAIPFLGNFEFKKKLAKNGESKTKKGKSKK